MVSRNPNIVSKARYRQSNFLSFTVCAIILTGFNRRNNHFLLAGNNDLIRFFSLVSRIEKYNICVEIIFRQFLYNLIFES